MDRDTFESAAKIFVEAASLSTELRAAFIEKACAGNTELVVEVNSLLQASADADDYFLDLSNKLGVASSSDLPDLDPVRHVVGQKGTVIGAYTLTDPIGSGGSGTVWRAERTDGQFEGQVAIKIMNPTTASATALSRLRDEAQYLAKLSHPNIARLLDAGVDNENHPYLVLEFIDGTPIDLYCNSNYLDIVERIRLFTYVLQAVTHAHARLIVHRDIKPSNVLVDENGTVKLLDFGIAKLLSTESDGARGGLTVEVGAALTPEYAAPEQLLGQQITTATDVYALGLMLYELLAGRSPRDTSTIDSFAALVEVATQDPPKASSLVSAAEHRGISLDTLQRKLRGDLDNILQKSMAPDPELRYSSASDFASDLRRYLTGETVSAMPRTVGYRVQKFVGRHRGGVLTSVLTAIALVISLVIATSQMLEARKQRDAAVYQQQRALASNEFLLLLLNEIGPEGKALTMNELLDHGVEMLEQSFGEEYPFLGRMQVDLARGYYSLGNMDKMRDLLVRAENVARGHEDSDLLAYVLCFQARIRYRIEPELAISQVDEADILLAGIASPSMDSFMGCTRANADMLESRGDRGAAIDLLIKALVTLNESEYASAQNRIFTMNQLANLHGRNGRNDLALAVVEELLEIQEQTGRGATLGYMINTLNRSVYLQSMGEAKYAFEIRQGLLGRMRELQETGRAPISFMSFYATSLHRLGRYEEALAVSREAYEAAREAGHTNWAAQDQLRTSRVLTRMGRYDEAEDYLKSAEATFQKSPGSNDRLLHAATLARAGILYRRGDSVDARRLIDTELKRLDYPNTKSAPELSSTLQVAAEVAFANGQAALAEEYASEYHALAVTAARDPKVSSTVGYALLMRAKARLMQGKDEAAQGDLRMAIGSLTNGLGEDHPETVEARELLGYESGI